VAQRSACRGVEAHKGGAGWSALRCLEQWSAVTREQRSAARAERSGVARRLSQEEERRRLPRTDNVMG
jgi:hypothetical protein